MQASKRGWACKAATACDKSCNSVQESGHIKNTRLQLVKACGRVATAEDTLLQLVQLRAAPNASVQ
jgi:hypothetical protein